METLNSIKALIDSNDGSTTSLGALEKAALKESLATLAPLLETAEGIEKLGLNAADAVQLKMALKCLEELKESEEMDAKQLGALKKCCDLLEVGAEERHEHLAEVLAAESVAALDDSKTVDGCVILSADGVAKIVESLKMSGVDIELESDDESDAACCLREALKAGLNEDGALQLSPEQSALLKDMLEKAAKTDTHEDGIEQPSDESTTAAEVGAIDNAMETLNSIKALIDSNDGSTTSLGALEKAALKESLATLAPLLETAEGIEKLGLNAADAVQLKMALKCLEELKESEEMDAKQLGALKKCCDLLEVGAEERHVHLAEVLAAESVAALDDSKTVDGCVILSADGVAKIVESLKMSGVDIELESDDESDAACYLREALKAGLNEDGALQLSPEQSALLKDMLEKAAKTDTHEDGIEQPSDESTTAAEVGAIDNAMETLNSIKALIDSNDGSTTSLGALEKAALKESLATLAPLLETAEGIEKLGLNAADAVQLKMALKCLEELKESEEMDAKQLGALKKCCDLLEVGAEERHVHLAEVLAAESVAALDDSKTVDGCVILSADGVAKIVESLKMSGVDIELESDDESDAACYLREALKAGLNEDGALQLSPEQSALLKDMLEKAAKTDTHEDGIEQPSDESTTAAEVGAIDNAMETLNSIKALIDSNDGSTTSLGALEKAALKESLATLAPLLETAEGIEKLGLNAADAVQLKMALNV